MGAGTGSAVGGNGVLFTFLAVAGLAILLLLVRRAADVVPRRTRRSDGVNPTRLQRTGAWRLRKTGVVLLIAGLLAGVSSFVLVVPAAGQQNGVEEIPTGTEGAPNVAEGVTSGVTSTTLPGSEANVPVTTPTTTPITTPSTDATTVTSPGQGLDPVSAPEVTASSPGPNGRVNEEVNARVTGPRRPVPGNNGTVKIHEGDREPRPITRTQPHVCTFHVHALFFDPVQLLSYLIRSWPPTGDKTTVATGSITTDQSGEGRSRLHDELSDGHYKLFVRTNEPGGKKHKVFWVECESGPPGTFVPPRPPEVRGFVVERSVPAQSTSLAPRVRSRFVAARPSAQALVAAHRQVGVGAALPFTGIDPSPFLTASGLLMSTGGGLIFASRRRRA